MSSPASSFRDTAALIASLSALVLAAVCYLSRWGFSDDLPGPVLCGLGLSWFLIHFPYAVRRWWRRAGTSPSWLVSDGTLSLAGLLFCVLLGRFVGVRAGIPLALCGAGFVFVRYASLPRRGEFGWSIGAVFWGAVLGAWLACIIWGDGYHNPLYMQSLSNGNMHIDTLFHATILNMLRNYGIPSTGLDGVPYLHYYFGSHFILGQIGGLLRLPALAIYQLAFPIVFLPLLVHGALVAAMTFARPCGADRARVLFLVCPVLIIVCGGVLPFSTTMRMAINWEGSLQSESMCLALIVLFFGMAAGAPLLQGAEGAKSGRPWVEKALAVVAYPAFIAALGFLKLSVMSVILAASVLTFLTTRSLRRDRLAGLSLLAGCGAFFWVKGLVFDSYYGTGAEVIQPLKFLRDFVPQDWWAYYFLCELSLTLVAVVLRLRQAGCVRLEDLIRAWRIGELVDLKFLLFSAAIGFLPGLLLEVPAGSAALFSDVQRWVSLPILLGVLLSPGRRTADLSPGTQSILRVPLWKFGASILLLSVGATVALNTRVRVRTLRYDNLAARGFSSSVGSAPDPFAPRSILKQALRRGDVTRAWKLVREQTALQEGRTDPPARVVRLLADLDHLTRAEKRVTLLFIPRTNRTYWSLCDRTAHPRWAAPFLAPALSGLALLDGLPEPEEMPPYYGYPCYLGGARLGPDPSRADLCRKAESLGFRRVLVFDAGPQGEPILWEWCLGGARPLLDDSGRVEQ